jgi:ribosomal protein S18 acetylase RimI-like enzyme
MSQIDIRVAKEASAVLLDSMAELIPQLSTTAPALTFEELKMILECPASHLFLAYEDEKIVGMLTLIVAQIPTGLRALIEDVVVSNSYRQRGIGTALNRAAIELATNMGVRTIELTSRPSRVEAIRVYERLGFKPRDTGVYRLSSGDSVG